MNGKPPKEKTCPICGGKFTPFSSTQRVDSTICAIEYNKQKDKKKAKRKDLARKKAFYENDLAKQHELTQPVFNK